MALQEEIKEEIDRLRTLKELAEERILMFREEILSTEKLPSGSVTTDESIKSEEKYVIQLDNEIAALQRQLK